MTDTVTLSRADYEALLARIEDAEDAAAVAVHRAREAALGLDVARADHLPVALVDRLLAGDSPVRVWRQHRGLNQSQLAAAAGVSPAYLNEIEKDKKPGSLQAMHAIAKALGVLMEDLFNGASKEI